MFAAETDAIYRASPVDMRMVMPAGTSGEVTLEVNPRQSWRLRAQIVASPAARRAMPCSAARRATPSAARATCSMRWRR